MNMSETYVSYSIIDLNLLLFSPFRHTMRWENWQSLKLKNAIPPFGTLFSIVEFRKETYLLLSLALYFTLRTVALFPLSFFVFLHQLDVSYFFLSMNYCYVSQLLRNSVISLVFDSCGFLYGVCVSILECIQKRLVEQIESLIQSHHWEASLNRII